MGYLKLFENTAAYEEYINGSPLLPRCIKYNKTKKLFL